jgi:hypothetical protein
MNKRIDTNRSGRQWYCNYWMHWSHTVCCEGLREEMKTFMLNFFREGNLFLGH